MKYIGAHIKKESSVIKTLQSISNCEGNALQIFVSNPRSVQNGNIEKYREESNDIIKYCQKNNMKLVIHAPYTINLAKEAKDGKRVLDLQDCYWIKLLLNNLEISDIIDAIGVVFHVGKYTSYSKENSLENMFIALKYIIKIMKEKQIKSKLIIETPAGAGTELLTNDMDFIHFYDKFSLDEKQYIKICLDTAHIWSSGQDINEYYSKIKENKNNIMVIHFNNSKKELGSKVDVHETIFEGKIKIETMKMFIRNLKYDPIIILEKPSDNLHKEIYWIKK